MQASPAAAVNLPQLDNLKLILINLCLYSCDGRLLVTISVNRPTRRNEIKTIPVLHIGQLFLL